ncbi:MAG: ABC transporter permease, partial [Fuerstiella sp.]|nr:ABC transporter permease [Fuerstiella sp.]
SADSEESHDELFTIVSVLRQTGTPNDRSVFLNLEAVYILDGHQKPIDEVETRLQDFYGNDPERLNITLGQMEELKKRRAKGQEIGDESMGYGLDTPDAMKEITAVYVKTREVFDAISLQSQLKNGSKAMAVNPIRPIKRLMTSFVGPIMSALMVLTGMIIVVSGISIFVSIYNSMSDRKREIGIMRALGARRSSVFSIILAESTVLCVGGGLMGWLIGHGLSVAFA